MTFSVTSRRLLLFWLVILPAAASLASSAFGASDSLSSTTSSTALPYQVLSRNKNNGHVVAYSFPDTDNDSALYPLQSATATSSPTPRAVSSSRFQFHHPAHSMARAIRSTFLPSGYPSPSRPHFLQYCAWSWTQDLTTQLRSVLATQRVLEGVGVGRPGATALSALLNFLCRDGCGMVASLVFTSVAATKFKHNVKQWRLVADIMVDIGITLEVLAVQMPPAYFLAMISVGNMCKAICGVAAGACGGAINMHWAKGFGNANSNGNNGADISEIQAKFGAQNTVAGSLGLVCSALFARSASKVDNLRIQWLLYGGLTALHIFANVQCMRLLALDTFNTLRLKLVVADYLSRAAAVDASREQSLTPTQVSKQEPLFFIGMHRAVSRNNRGVLPTNVPILFGVSFAEYSSRSGLLPDQLRLQWASRAPYFIALGRHGRRNQKPCVIVALSKRASENDQIKAYFHALLLTEAVASVVKKEGTAAFQDDSVRRRIEIETITRLDGHLWNDFTRQCLRAGWDLSSNQLASQGFEVVPST